MKISLPLEYDNVVFVDNMACDLITSNYQHGFKILAIDPFGDDNSLIHIRVESVGGLKQFYSEHYIKLLNNKIRYFAYKITSSASSSLSAQQRAERAERDKMQSSKSACGIFNEFHDGTNIKAMMHKKFESSISSMIIGVLVSKGFEVI